MVETNSGEPRSSLNTEQSAPKGSSLPEEKKVSNVNNSANPRRKRYILDCVEHADGSLSHCDLIPLNDMTHPNSSADRQEDDGTTPTDTQQEKASEAQCTPRKCNLPSSIRKRIARETNVPTEVDKNKR